MEGLLAALGLDLRRHGSVLVQVGWRVEGIGWRVEGGGPAGGPGPGPAATRLRAGAGGV